MLNNQDNEALAADIRSALARDFNFKQQGKYYRGKCPNRDCGKPKAWTEIDRPFVIFCSRASCHETPIRDLYPDFYENFSERYPTTPQDKNATARAYLSVNRSFDISKLTCNWEQGSKRLPSGDFAETVRFPLWGQHYWERIIDNAKAQLIENKRKASFSFGIKYTGKHWAPDPNLTIEDGDQIFIVEGIFHAIALHLSGKKVISAFSCNNLPTDIIEANADKKVTWVLAYDNDANNAGNDATLKYKDKLEKKNKTVTVSLAPRGQDWDDCYRAKLLGKKSFWFECEYRGGLLCAKTFKDYAYQEYLFKEYRYKVFPFKNALYRAKIDAKLNEKVDGDGDAKDQLDIFSKEGNLEFRSNASIEKISNSYPRLLYIEHDDLLNERLYTFLVSYENTHPDTFLSVEGGNLESASSFNKALLKNTNGAMFKGSAVDMQILLEKWLAKITTVSSLPFVGYDPNSKAYIFPKVAIHAGREIPLNDQGYFNIGKRGIKTNLKSYKLEQGDFNPQILQHLYGAWGVNGLVSLAMWTSILFAQQIRSEYKSLPFFELTGEPGAGKTTLIRLLWRLLGRDNYEGFDPSKARPAGRRRTLAQGSNMPAVFIESDRDDGTNQAKIKSFEWDELKPLYDGGGLGTLGIAKRGNDTDEPIFQGGLVISQNASVDASTAMLERIVHLHYLRANRTTAHHVKALDSATNQELAGYLVAVLKKESEYMQLFTSAQEKHAQALWEGDYIKHSAVRLILNHSQVMAAVDCLALVFPQITQQQVTECHQHIISRMTEREQRIQGDHPVVRDFWATYDYLQGHTVGRVDSAFEDTINLNHAQKPDAEIAINLNEFAECCRKYNQPLADLKDLRKLLTGSTSRQYIKHEKVHSPLNKRTMQLWRFKVEG